MTDIDGYCNGSYERINCSTHEIMRGFVRCPYCGRPLKVRKYKENDDDVRTLPRHKTPTDKDRGSRA